MALIYITSLKSKATILLIKIRKLENVQFSSTEIKKGSACY